MANRVASARQDVTVSTAERGVTFGTRCAPKKSMNQKKHNDRINDLNNTLIDALDSWLRSIPEGEAEDMAEYLGNDPENDLRSVVAEHVDSMTNALEVS